MNYMKKTLLITAGVIVLLSIVGVWVYLFLFGAPENAGNIFGNFGTEDNGEIHEPNISETNTNPSEEGVGDTQALRQLTTRPVAGAVFAQNAVRYVERGTGHIYEVPVRDGDELLISNTTIPQTIEAIFSSDGTRVVMTAQRNEKNETIVASIDFETTESTALEAMSLPEAASNIAWNEAGDGLFYLLKTNAGSAGYLYSPVTGKSTQLFQIPLHDVVVLWGEPTYVYTTPTALQTGYVYRMVKGQLEYVTAGGRALMAVKYPEGLLLTKTTNGEVGTETLEDSPYQLPIALMHEKCVAVPNQSSRLYCAAPSTQPTGVFPDEWYKGEISFSDQLWQVDIDDTRAMVLSSFLAESGREIDVSSIGTDFSGDYIYFINKNDGTLWMLDTTKL